MSLRRLDLNLLISLDALLAERSVTGAARTLGLSQPALSAALARLRRHFDDPLLTRVGNRYELTPLARQLRPRTTAALSGAERVFSSRAVFDPETTRREFTLYVSDYVTEVFMPHLDRALFARAPGVSLRLSQFATDAVNDAATALRSVDGMLLPRGFIADLPSLDLYHDEWVCLVDADHPGVTDHLTVAHLQALPWVLTFHGPTAFTPAARQMRMLGIEPRVEVVIENFLSLPTFIVGTPRVALVQKRLAALLARPTLRVMPCPFPAVPLTMALWWHPVLTPDPEHEWLRAVVAEVAASLPALPDPRDVAGPGPVVRSPAVARGDVPADDLVHDLGGAAVDGLHPGVEEGP